MNPTLDQILVLATVLGAVGFFVWRLVPRGKKGCSGGCGCDVAKKAIVKRP